MAEPHGFRILTEAPTSAETAWMLMAPMGSYTYDDYGEIAVDADFCGRVVRNFKSGVRAHSDGTLPVNREHVAALGAVGWITDVKADERGLWAHAEWNEDGTEAIDKRAFKWLSPEWYPEWRDPKDPAKVYHDVLVGLALTNYPRFYDLPAVAASEARAAAKRASESYTQIVDAVSGALTARFGFGCWVREVFEDRVVYELNGSLWSATYSLAGDGDADDVQFGMPQEVEVQYVTAMAEWTTAFVNDLPDSSFAYIEPGGEKDEEGKTKPRSKRHFPIKDADGKPDAAHVRNALSRAPQSPFEDKAMPKIRAAAKALGIGEEKKSAEDGGDRQMADAFTHDHAHRHGGSDGNAGYTHGHRHAHAQEHAADEDHGHGHTHDIAMSEKEASMASAGTATPPAATTASEGSVTINASELKTLREQAAQAPTAMAEARKARETLRLMSVDAAITKAKAEGRIVPAQETAYRDRLIKASDEDFEWLRGDLLGRPKVLAMEAIGSGEGGEPGSDVERRQLHERATKYMSEHKGVSYADSLLAVGRESK